MTARIELEVVDEDGATWRHLDSIIGYDEAAQELIAMSDTLSVPLEDIADTLADGNTVSGVSVTTGRLIRARAEQVAD